MNVWIVGYVPVCWQLTLLWSIQESFEIFPLQGSAFFKKWIYLYFSLVVSYSQETWKCCFSRSPKKSIHSSPLYKNEALDPFFCAYLQELVKKFPFLSLPLLWQSHPFVKYNIVRITVAYQYIIGPVMLEVDSNPKSLYYHVTMNNI